MYDFFPSFSCSLTFRRGPLLSILERLIGAAQKGDIRPLSLQNLTIAVQSKEVLHSMRLRFLVNVFFLGIILLDYLKEHVKYLTSSPTGEAVSIQYCREKKQGEANSKSYLVPRYRDCQVSPIQTVKILDKTKPQAHFVETRATLVSFPKIDISLDETETVLSFVEQQGFALVLLLAN